MKKFLDKYKGLGMFLIGYFVLCFVMLFLDGSFLFAMLAWNTLLATLPLLFVNLAIDKFNIDKTLVAIVFFVLWLLFFPNAIYMITDFIHITSDNLISYDITHQYMPNGGVIYSQDIIAWTKLFVISLGAFYAVTVGLESLRIFFNFIKTKFSDIISRIVIIVVSLLSGFGVFIGRFLRFNSWDIFRPLYLVNSVISSIDQFALLFSLSFGLFIIGSFMFYNYFIKTVRD